MHPKWFGDSYDIVKRFFCDAFRHLGYDVYVEPMFTEPWPGNEQAFFDFLGAKPHPAPRNSGKQNALLLDPDTGVSNRASMRHVSFQSLADRLSEYALVFVFDQSFARGAKQDIIMQEKLAKLEALGACGFYYDSNLLSLGLPSSRLLTSWDGRRGAATS